GLACASVTRVALANYEIRRSWDAARAAGRPAPRGRGGKYPERLFLAALDAHQQALGLGILDAIHELGAFVHVAQRLGQVDRRLQHDGPSHGDAGVDATID